MTLDNKHTLTAKVNAVANERAEDFAAARRGLVCLDRFLIESFAPVGSQHAMRASRYGIFGNSFERREVTTDDVVSVIARSGDDEARSSQGGDLLQIRFQFSDSGCAVKNSEMVVFVDSCFDGLHADAFCDGGGVIGWFARSRRKVHLVSRVLFGDCERAALRMKDNLRGRWVDALHNDSGACERRVSAERDFDDGSEPGDLPILVFAKKECRFRQVVFRRDLEFEVVVDFLIEENDGGRISAEAGRCEGIELKEGKPHESLGQWDQISR